MTSPDPYEYDAMEPIAETDDRPIVADAELPPVSRADLMKMIEKAKDQEGAPSAPEPSTFDPTANLRHVSIVGMPPSYQAILDFAEARRGQWIGWSETVSYAPAVRKHLTKAASVKAAVWELTKSYGALEVAADGKRYRLPEQVELVREPVSSSV